MRDNWFAKTPAWIFLDERLDWKETYVFTALGLFADTKNRCFPSIQRLAEICKISRASVENALRGLEKKGLIHKKFRYEKNTQTTTLYSLAKQRYEPPEPPPTPHHVRALPSPDEGSSLTTKGHPPHEVGTEQSHLTDPDNRASEQQNRNENTHANFSEKEGEKIGNTRQNEVQRTDERLRSDVWKAFGKRRNA